MRYYSLDVDTTIEARTDPRDSMKQSRFLILATWVPVALGTILALLGSTGLILTGAALWFFGVGAQVGVYVARFRKAPPKQAVRNYA